MDSAQQEQPIQQQQQQQPEEQQPNQQSQEQEQQQQQQPSQQSEEQQEQQQPNQQSEEKQQPRVRVAKVVCDCSASCVKSKDILPRMQYTGSFGKSAEVVKTTTTTTIPDGPPARIVTRKQSKPLPSVPSCDPHQQTKEHPVVSLVSDCSQPAYSSSDAEEDTQS